MKQKKKRSQDYRDRIGSARPVKRRVEEKTPREPFTPFEKLLLAMFGISVLATIASLFSGLEMITYITIANYLILGLILLIRPSFIIVLLRKNAENIDEDYRKKELYLSMALRVGGLVFLGIAYLLLYNMGVVPNPLPF